MDGWMDEERDGWMDEKVEKEGKSWAQPQAPPKLTRPAAKRTSEPAMKLIHASIGSPNLKSSMLISHRPNHININDNKMKKPSTSSNMIALSLSEVLKEFSWGNNLFCWTSIWQNWIWFCGTFCCMLESTASCWDSSLWEDFGCSNDFQEEVIHVAAQCGGLQVIKEAQTAIPRENVHGEDDEVREETVQDVQHTTPHCLFRFDLESSWRHESVRSFVHGDNEGWEDEASRSCKQS